MARTEREVDKFVNLRGYAGQVGTIWVYVASTAAQRDEVFRVFERSHENAVVRVGLGVWRAIRQGAPVRDLYPTKEAALLGAFR